MVKFYQYLGMLLFLNQYSLCYRLLNPIKEPNDHYDIDKAFKLKMLRLLNYANKLNRENEKLHEYEVDFNYPEDLRRPERFRYFNRRNMPIPFNLNYEFLIAEPIKRDYLTENKMKALNYYDLDEYDESNDWGYDDVDYQKLFKNYIQRNSDNHNQRTVCKICKGKLPCHHLHTSKNKISNYNINQKIQKPSKLKPNILFEYSDDDLPKSSHSKRKHKGFQLFMLNDDESNIGDSMIVDEVRPLRTTVGTKETELEEYMMENHKFRKRHPNINKYRRHKSEINPMNIKISDVEQKESPKYHKETDYSDFDVTQDEKVVHIPPLKYASTGKDQVLDKLTTKRHQLSDIRHETEISDNRDFKTSKSVLTTSTFPTSVSPKHENFDDYPTEKSDYDKFINDYKNDISSYEEDMELLKKSKKPSNNSRLLSDYESEMAQSNPCSGSTTSYGIDKNLFSGPEKSTSSYKIEKNPSDTERNPSLTQKNNDLNTGESMSEELNPNFQENQKSKLKPFTEHPNLNKYTNKHFSNDQSADLKLEDDELRPHANNYKSNDQLSQHNLYNSWAARRPDGWVSNKEVSFYDHNDKLQSFMKGGEDPLLGHLKQHKGDITDLNSTSPLRFSDYDESELSSMSDKITTKRLEFNKNNEVKEDDEKLMNDLFFSKIVNNTRPGVDSLNDDSSKEITSTIPKHFAQTDFDKENEENNQDRRDDEDEVEDENSKEEDTRRESVKPTKTMRNKRRTRIHLKARKKV